MKNLNTIPELLKIVEASPEYQPAKKPSGAMRLSDVKSKSVQWLWHGRIPLGKITVLDGDPGLGKSTVTLDLASRISLGQSMPGDETPREPAGVVLLSAEDDPADTIRPRLEATGADLERISTIGMIPTNDGARPLVLPEDLIIVEHAVDEVGASLVVIDPLFAYLTGEVNSFRDQDIRRALFPISTMAERLGIAVLIVRHLNKAGGRPAIYRGGGSIGIIGAARSGLLIARDPEKAGDQDARVLSVVKCNLAKQAPSVRLRVVQSETGTGCIEWGESCAITADQLVSEPEPQKRGGKLDAAKEFLLDSLKGGPRKQTELIAEAEEAGISESTLNRAKGDLGIKPQKSGFSGVSVCWLWELPAYQTGNIESRRCSTESEGAQSQDMNIFGSDDHLRLDNGEASC